MLQLHNTSPFVAQILCVPDLRGVDTLCVVIKASFRLAAQLEIAEQQQPVVLADEYWGEPGASSLRYPGEVHPHKPVTDVLVLAQACAPQQRPVTMLDVDVCVGDRQVRARVYGDRVWSRGVTGLVPSQPAPFSCMPLVWERAYGGSEQPEPGAATFAAEPRNPVGVGFLGTRHPEEFIGQRVPNIDDPRAPLTRLGQSPAPLGFGALAASWQPRVSHAGTYDQRWLETRAPYLPTDFDARFFNTAPAQLCFASGLMGGEVVQLHGLHPAGPIGFALPRCEFDLSVTIAGTKHRPEPRLETVILEPTDERITMTWRAVECVDKQLLAVERIDVGLAQLHGATAARARAS